MDVTVSHNRECRHNFGGVSSFQFCGICRPSCFSHDDQSVRRHIFAIFVMTKMWGLLVCKQHPNRGVTNSICWCLVQWGNWGRESWIVLRICHIGDSFAFPSSQQFWVCFVVGATIEVRHEDILDNYRISHFFGYFQ